MEKELSRSAALAARMEKAVLELLEKNGGEMRRSDLIKAVPTEYHLDEWEAALPKETSEHPRWRTALVYYSIDLNKAGFIKRKDGIWYITDDGREALKLPAAEVYLKAAEAYHKWEEQCEQTSETPDMEVDSGGKLSLSDIKSQASDDRYNYIRERTPYEFQDLVAALLRAMGYYTPFVAPKGKDGGVDIIAYSHPLGASGERLKVQVKHYGPDNPVSVDTVRQISAVAKGDTPIVVTSGRFAETAKTEARVYNVRLIDGVEFEELWISYYGQMKEEDKALMPIEPVYFIKREE